MSFQNRLNGKRGVLLKNTVMLYILTISTYVLGLIVVPYETRVLGPAIYGMVGATAAAMIYFQNVIDFGFILSGTEDVSLHRTDKPYLRRVFTSVTLAKLFLALVSAGVLALLCGLIPVWREHTLFYFLYFFSVFVGSLLPDYLYRGMEQMEVITIRTVLIKTFFTIMLFVFMRNASQYYLIPILNIIGNAAAFFGVYLHLHKKMDIRFCAVSIRDVGGVLKKSLPFFYSRIATTIYTATNTIVLNIITATGAATGYYTSADKIITTAKSGMSPISDSLYPYMVKNRDFRLVKKALLLLVPVIVIGCVIVWIFAEPLCVLFFGKEYAPSAQVLRTMLPVVMVILPSYVMGFPMLSAMQLTKYANYSTIFGSVLYVGGIALLLTTGWISMITLGILVSVVEISIFLYRVIVIYRHRDRLRPAAIRPEEGTEDGKNE